jgi:hypothetical protein
MAMNTEDTKKTSGKFDQPVFNPKDTEIANKLIADGKVKISHDSIKFKK